MLDRPRPPEDMVDVLDGGLSGLPVRPAPELEAWMRATFIDDDAALANEDHAHLQSARLGVMWCSVDNARNMNSVVGQAELPQFQGGRWSKARQVQQIVGWFGEMPDFLITFHAPYAAECSDAAFCSLVEHELYHCGQERDENGAPKFKKDGSPKFGIRGHDVEEFVGVVARYGVGAAAGQTAALVEAAGRAPLICTSEIAGACGTCGGSFT
jgi:hypothetical protein